MRIIPQKNIYKLRFGQLLFNALEHANIWYRENYGNEVYIGQNKDIFYIENDKLEKIIQDFLEFYIGTCNLNEKKKTKTNKKRDS